MNDVETSCDLGRGPEDVLVCADGSVLTGLEDGRILRLSPDLSTMAEIGNTDGRPLGLEHLPDGRVLICDATRGLLAMELETGLVSVLVRDPPPFCNNAAVGADGTVYFSSSSRRHPIEHSTRDVVEARPTGSLWQRAPDGTCTCLLDELYFANGVVLAPDESHVLVAETGAARVQRFWLAGPRVGEAEMFVDDLPALPDNMSVGTDGQVWVALVVPAAASRAVWRLPYPLRWLAVRVVRNGPATQRLQAMALDWQGNVTRQIDRADAGYHFVTGVRKFGGALYLGSIAENRIARLELEASHEV